MKMENSIEKTIFALFPIVSAICYCLFKPFKGAVKFMIDSSTSSSSGDSSPFEEEGDKVRLERRELRFPVLTFLTRVLAVLIAFNVLIISVELTRELNEAFRVVIAGAATMLTYGAVRMIARFTLYKLAHRKVSGIPAEPANPNSDTDDRSN